MAIKIERGPSMVDYGQAIAAASQKVYENERMKDYANYLAGIKKANQDYALGLGKLGVDTKEQGEFNTFRNRQLDWNIASDAQKMQMQQEAAARNYQINWWNSGADILNANVNAMRAHGQLYNN